MTPEQPTNISVIDPLNPAFERMKVILFKPFDLGKWFVIGFCAWLASFGEGGSGGNMNFRGGDIQNNISEAKEYILGNLYWIVPVTVVIFLFGIAIWLLFTWLSSRGRFMFLHSVAHDKAEVKVPWKKFRQHANSLFLFRIVMGLIAFVSIGLPCLFVVFCIFGIVSGPHYFGPILGIVLVALLCFALGIAFWLVKRFTTDFVLPIMFLGTSSCTAAWRQFLTLLRENKGSFAVYALFRIIIAIAISITVIAVVIGTCCCACCVLMIPYIRTVALLPILVFERSYSLCYFRQFGPQFDVFIPEAEATV